MSYRTVMMLAGALVLATACADERRRLDDDDGGPTNGAACELSIENQTGSALDAMFVYVSSGDVGPNQLGSPLGDGGELTLSDVPPGRYDVAAVAVDAWAYRIADAVECRDGETLSTTLLSLHGTGPVIPGDEGGSAPTPAGGDGAGAGAGTGGDGGFGGSASASVSSSVSGAGGAAGGVPSNGFGGSGGS